MRFLEYNSFPTSFNGAGRRAGKRHHRDDRRACRTAAGRVFVDNLSWRWIFYINLPIGIAALAAFAVAFKARDLCQRHDIDYPGTALLTTSLSAIVLFTSLGGRSYDWNSSFILGLIAVAALGAVTFV